MKTRNLKLAALIAMMFIAPFANAQKVKGSDTCLPLSQKEAEAYSHKGGKVTVTGGGSGVGIAALISGTTDIAQASRKMKFSEKQKLRDAGRSAKEVVIAYDALAIVVNPANPVSKLTKTQLAGIFTGKITNWKQVGGPDEKIVVYSRESSSGTYDFIKEHVMDNRNYATTVLSMPATGAIIQSVKQTKGAIGYVGLAYLTKGVKALQVSYDGKHYAAPSVANAKNKTYPIVRPLLYYYNVSEAKKVMPFINFVLSQEGQNIVDKVGYIAIK